ncbi:STM3941 family protein [Nocardia lasii]|uniref:STM3941 family protein n=1 Tax=Nocardia lasii TaxID=1616107 RepID=A0ABW1JVH1_9NOCA
MAYAWLMLAAFVMFAGIGFCMVLAGDEAYVTRIVGVAGLLFCAFGTVFIASRLIWRKPELVVTYDGLYFRQFGWIGWDEVAHADIWITRTRGPIEHRNLRVVLRDPTAFFARSSLWVRTMHRLNRGFTPDCVVLSSVLLGAPSEQALAAMRHYHPTLPIRQ